MKALAFVFLSVLALSACGKKETETPVPTEADGTQNVPTSSLDPAVVAEEPADALDQTSESENDFVVDEPLPPFDEGMDGDPELVADGMFFGVAPAEASGRFLLYRLPDGSHLLRLEELRVTAAADLQLRLARAEIPQTAADATDGFSLGALKGPSGNQNYLIGSHRKLNGLQSVVIAPPDAAVSAYATFKRG